MGDVIYRLRLRLADRRVLAVCLAVLVLASLVVAGVLVFQPSSAHSPSPSRRQALVDLTCRRATELREPGRYGHQCECACVPGARWSGSEPDLPESVAAEQRPELASSARVFGYSASRRMAPSAVAYSTKRFERLGSCQ